MQGCTSARKCRSYGRAPQSSSASNSFLLKDSEFWRSSLFPYSGFHSKRTFPFFGKEFFSLGLFWTWEWPLLSLLQFFHPASWRWGKRSVGAPLCLLYVEVPCHLQGITLHLLETGCSGLWHHLHVSCAHNCFHCHLGHLPNLLHGRSSMLTESA